MSPREELGRHAWQVLHYEAARGNHKRVDEILRRYPCQVCRQHVETTRHTIPFFEQVPRYGLAQWVYLLHNRVNLDLKKKLLPWDDFDPKAYQTKPNESISYLEGKK